MCEIPNDYGYVEDVVDELKGLKAQIELDVGGIFRHIDEVIHRFTGECKKVSETATRNRFY